MKERENIYLTPLFGRLFIPFGAAYFFSRILAGANAIISPLLVETFSLPADTLGFMSSIYLISFGLAQFPVGVFSDRVGARATLAPMLLFAAAGALVFAYSEGLTSMIISRVLIGIGFSGALMTAFLAYASWFPAERLPVVYSFQSLMGGLGGMAATTPVAFACEYLGWREVYLLLAVIMLICSAMIWFVVPKNEPSLASKSESPVKQLIEMLKLFGDRRFWLVSAITNAAESVLFAYLFLWIGPWMFDVAGLDINKAGFFMMFASAGTCLGYIGNGTLANFFKKRGWMTWEQLYCMCGALMAFTLFLIAVINGPAASLLWVPAMFFSTMTMISFPIARTMYSKEEIGRALSLINFTIFVSSFIMQWFVGFVIGLFPSSGGHFAPEGYRIGIVIMAALNLAATLFYYSGMKKRRV
ncbi:MAG: MFS transporter [Synergistes sp.]|nr:MFS transporter [Synergistes sp.]